MSYVDTLRRVTMPDGRRMVGASFRGVPFYVVASERGGGGRRAVLNEFPFRDTPWVDDLGRGAKTFRLEGYVVGDDYVEQRNRLQAALDDEAGPGELVHPYWGVLHAQVDGPISINESADQGRMAVFVVNFIETPAQFIFLTDQSDPETAMANAADAALLATAADLADSYDADGMPRFALESAADALIAATDAVDEALAPITGTTAELARMQQNVKILRARAATLVTAPADALTAFRDTFGALVDTALNAPLEVMQAFIDAASFDAGVRPPTTTATRLREQGNWDAITKALRNVLAIEAARLAPRVKFTTYDEAVTVRDQVAALIDAQADAADDATYLALVEMRSLLTQHVPGEQLLSRVVVVRKPAAVPSLVLAYELNGNVDREAEIIERNSIRHPGFVAGDVEVLTDE